MKRLSVVLFCAAAYAQPSLVPVGGMVYNPDGTGFTGSMQVSSPGLVCGGVPVAAFSRMYSVLSGTVSPPVQLYPLADCSPGFPYSVAYSGSSQSKAAWVVHASPPSTTIGAVQTQALVASSLQLSFAQFPAGTTTGQVPTWGGSSWGLTVPGFQTPLTWLGASVSGALDQILGSAAQKPASYFQTAISGAPSTWPTIPSVTGNALLKGSNGNAGPAAAADVISLFGLGACSGYLRSDASCGSPGVPIVGTTPVDGAAVSYNAAGAGLQDSGWLLSKTGGLTCPSCTTPTKLDLNPTTVASLPMTGNVTERHMLVSDGVDPTDCTTGGGGTRHWCYWNGSGWAAENGVGPQGLTGPQGPPGATGANWTPTAPDTISTTCAGAVNWAPSAAMAGVLTLTGSCSLSVSGLQAGGYYTVQVIQGSGGSHTLALTPGGTGGCATWKVGGGGAGAVTPTATAGAYDVLALFYDGTNCFVNYRGLFN